MISWNWFVTGKAAGIGWIIAFLSLAFSVFVWLESRTTRNITYRIGEPRAAIVVSSQTSKLTVAFDGKPVTSDITAAQIAIWNSGNVTTEASDIIRTVHVVAPNHRILEATLRGASRDIVKPKLDRSRIEQGIVDIQWSIMEQNDGFSLQLIYDGPVDADLRVEGVLKSQPKIEPITRRVGPFNYPPLILSNVIVLIASSFFTWRAMSAPPGLKRKIAIAILVIVIVAPPPIATLIYKRAIVVPSNLTTWKGDVEHGGGVDF